VYKKPKNLAQGRLKLKKTLLYANKKSLEYWVGELNPNIGERGWAVEVENSACGANDTMWADESSFAHIPS